MVLRLAGSGVAGRQGAGSEGASAGCRTCALVGSMQLQPGWLVAGVVFCRGALRLGGFLGLPLTRSNAHKANPELQGAESKGGTFGAGVSDFFFLSILLLAGNNHPLQGTRLPLAGTELSPDMEGTNPPES